MTHSIIKHVMLLGLFALFTAVPIALTHVITEPRIEINKQKALEKKLFELLPKHTHDNNLLESKRVVFSKMLGHNKENYAYFAYQNEQVVALVLPVRAKDGYGGSIDLLVAIYTNGTLAGVRVIPPHNETPGLGDKIDTEKSDWILSFNGKSLSDPLKRLWGVKKDGGHFDQFTGATITPRAVVKAIKKSLLYFDQEKQTLLSP